jgi:cathepsin D
MYVHKHHFVGLEVCRLMNPSPALTVQGNSVTLAAGQGGYSAIDTGTTLIGGPQDVIAAIYANIPDSSPATGDFEGYYSYRKSSTLPI